MWRVALSLGAVAGTEAVFYSFVFRMISRRESTMLVHIFRGPGRVFGCTADGSGANLPSKFAPWTAFKSLELIRGAEPTPGVDTEACLSDIERHGFHITDAHTRITDSVV
jgi:hypothetical protein